MLFNVLFNVYYSWIIISNSSLQRDEEMKTLLEIILLFIFISWNMLVYLTNIVLSPFFSLFIILIYIIHCVIHIVYIIYIIQRLFVNDHFKFVVSVTTKVKRRRLVLLEMIPLQFFREQRWIEIHDSNAYQVISWRIVPRAMT